jgi:hypothetical protein
MYAVAKPQLSFGLSVSLVKGTAPMTCQGLLTPQVHEHASDHRNFTNSSYTYIAVVIGR